MFTGLIEGTGTIKALQPVSKGFSIQIESNFYLEDIKVGDSIAVDGVCLTVVSFTSKEFRADLSPETISRTTFKFRKPGDLVNLERALKMGDPLGGHLVTGHIDGVGQIKKITPLGNFFSLEIQVPKDLSPFLVPKGSIAIDGISLTINEVKEEVVTLMIIPHTYKVTTLHTKKVGDYVNIEIDIIAKMVYNFVKPYLKTFEKEPLSTLELLEKTGFI